MINYEENYCFKVGMHIYLFSFFKETEKNRTKKNIV
jgi:hypothetical protein